MSKRIKWALLALLGFSTACSTVRNTAKEPSADDSISGNPSPEAIAPSSDEHRIRVLYGVRRPEGQRVYTDGEASEAPAQQPAKEE
ncbi:MAG: hypothetical protein E7137_03195 [Rikenellaceae bacterium]|nr:hypothetical protein [Rikenellaceae bacterium]